MQGDKQNGTIRKIIHSMRSDRSMIFDEKSYFYFRLFNFFLISKINRVQSDTKKINTTL